MRRLRIALGRRQWRYWFWGPIAVGLLVVVACAAAVPKQPVEWEYRVCYFRMDTKNGIERTSKQFTDYLNRQLADEGWTYVGPVNQFQQDRMMTTDGIVAYSASYIAFRRPKR